MNFSTEGEAAAFLEQCALKCSASFSQKIYRDAFSSERTTRESLEFLKDHFNDFDYRIFPDRIKIAYARCGCDLVKDGFLHSGKMCICSKISLQGNLENVFGKGNASVCMKETILRGNEKCLFEIRIAQLGHKIRRKAMEDSKAVKKFMDGYNCAQAVVFNYAEALALPIDAALKMATGFGAGMGRKQEVCGAVSGGIMVLGSLFGRGEYDAKERQDDVYKKVRFLIDGFAKESGTILCREILDGCDLCTEQGQQRFKEENMKTICCACVDTVVRIMDRIIEGE